MTISYKQVTAANLVFCYIPVFLFLAGWCAWYFAAPGCLLLLLLFYQYFRSANQPSQADERLTIDRKLVWWVLGASAVLAVILGYGGLFIDGDIFTDYHKHAAVQQDLARYAWPVIYEDAGTPSMLVYYVGSYLFPGLVGKIFGSPILAELMMGVVGWIGMNLIFLNILFLVKAETTKAQIWAIVIYLGFYGLLIPLQLLMFKFNEDVILGYPQWYTYKGLQFRSSLVSIKWVWQQYTIPILGMSMLYKYHEQRKLYALWVLPALISGTWCFVTLVAYAVADYILSCVRDKKFYADVFSWQNILCALIGLLMVLYISGSVASDTTEELRFRLMTSWKYYLRDYLPFCIFMFGFYFWLIWKQTKKDSFFYITLFFLIVIPFWRASDYNDWVMCTSMPALFMLTIYCIRFLLSEEVKKEAHKKWVTLIVCLALNAPYPLFELYNTFHYTHMPERTMRTYSCLDCEEIDLVWRTHFYNYDYKESFFYKYIARK